MIHLSLIKNQNHIKKIIALSFLLLTAFACKKEEEKALEEPVPTAQSYRALHTGTGTWTIDRIIVHGAPGSNIADTTNNSGTIKFASSTSLFFTYTGYTPYEVQYSVNATMTTITINSDGSPVQGPITWTNANKMKFSIDTSEGSTELTSTYELTRQ